MSMKNALYLGVAALALAWLTAPAPLSAQSVASTMTTSAAWSRARTGLKPASG